MLAVKIMRGVAGSGKTHHSRHAWPNAFIVSADSFHTNKEGIYCYDVKRASEAHAWCLRKFAEFLADHGNLNEVSEDVLVVDNTNTTVAEIAPYYQLALAYGADVEIVQVENDGGWQGASMRGTHSVPHNTCRVMGQNIATEKLPPWWKVTLAFVK